MAGIQRFITYIYAYEEGKKGANKGFAKVEIRGNDCRMEIHIRDIRKSCQTGKVFLFREKDGRLDSIFAGEMKFLDGRGDCAIAFKTEAIKNTECSFRDIEGVLIMIEDDSICLSRWKEGNPIDVRVENVRQMTDTQQTAEAQVRQVSAVWQAENVSEPIQESALMHPTETKPTERAFESDPAAVPTQAQQAENTPEQTAESEPIMATTTRQVAETEPTTAKDSKWQENIQATEIPMRNIFPQYQWLEVWEELQKTHPTFTLHQEKEISCVRIDLKDLRELPQKYWYFGNNSFLLHGFFNYRYLVIGRLEVDRWFIGVPGIYQPQERVMAAIFGFTEFLPQDEPVDKKINKFGYWYHVF